ncbi:hypothetical protein SDC9_95659 [bioreactor metagenome]|uniref:Uncharacterized protein n=1 Tax=bioreactor metagenome TaxID=1076179 RepID=A0A645A748_9ZZZZ
MQLCPSLAVAEDVLQYDDGAVYRHAQPQYEAGQGHEVERIAHEEHHQDGEQHGNWYGYAYDERRFQTPEEDEQHHHDQGDTVQQTLVHRVDRRLYHRGGVYNDFQAHALRQFLVEVDDEVVDALCNLDAVGIRLLGDGNVHSRFPIDVHPTGGIAVCIRNRGDVRKTHHTRTDHIPLCIILGERGYHGLFNLIE